MSELVNRPLVWIADDSETTARFTESALGDRYRYEWFSDGAAVVERIAAGARLPDALLLDWVMPAMTGGDVCKFLRSRPETVDLPIIIVTASRVETADVVQGLSIGANDYVARPFVPEELPRSRRYGDSREASARCAAPRESPAHRHRETWPCVHRHRPAPGARARCAREDAHGRPV